MKIYLTFDTDEETSNFRYYLTSSGINYSIEPYIKLGTDWAKRWSAIRKLIVCITDEFVADIAILRFNGKITDITQWICAYDLPISDSD